MKALRNLAIAALVAAAACGGSSDSGSLPTVGNPSTGNPSGGSDPVSTNAVAVSDNLFTPTNILVSVGTTVTWTWGGAAAHNVTFGDGTVSGDKTTGTFTRTFSSAGTFNYSCTLHPGMIGSVKVQ